MVHPVLLVGNVPELRRANLGGGRAEEWIFTSKGSEISDFL